MYDPTSRVLTVLEILQFRPGISGAELAQRLEVDVRTVRRYILKLQDAGIPIESTPGRYGGYRLRSGYKLPPLVFTREEATHIVLGLLGSPWLPVERSSSAVAAAISKITRVLPDEARERIRALCELRILPDQEANEGRCGERLIEISQAIQSQSALTIEYTSQRGETTERVVEPYGLVGRRRRWYLIAFCRLRDSFRTFRVDRIERCTISDARFERREGFDVDVYARENLESMTFGKSYTVRFHARADGIKPQLSDLAGRLEPSPDGVMFSATTDDWDYEARALARIGEPFTVLEPDELRDAVVRLIELLLRSVKPSTPTRTTA